MRVIDMPAGRVLDSLIAIHVFDCDPSLIADARLGGLDTQVSDGRYGYHVGEMYTPGPPPYSTDLAAAWQVVERLSKRGWELQLNNDRNMAACMVSFSCPYGPCKIHGTTTDNWHGTGVVARDTAPHAIAIAALLAVGVEEVET